MSQAKAEKFTVRPLVPADQVWVALLLIERWAATQVVSRGKLYAADRLPGFAALLDGRPAGLVTYHIEKGDCEIISLDSLSAGRGIGSALIAAVRKTALAANCRRLWLITTNDNLPALRFYQKRGFQLAALYPKALEISRRLKPEIPLIGLDDIPLRDEIELEMLLV